MQLAYPDFSKIRNQMYVWVKANLMPHNMLRLPGDQNQMQVWIKGQSDCNEFDSIIPDLDLLAPKNN